MPLRVVQRVKQTWAEIGEVCRDRRHKGRATLLSTENTKVFHQKPSMSPSNSFACTSRWWL
jgi:hypothetical protein